MTISPQRQREIIDALRRGTVPRQGLETFAVGLDPFASVIDNELQLVRTGGSVFKAIRGDYGSGKTFFVRWLQERAKALGFAAAEIQISETETPLHRLETVYRRFMERLSTTGVDAGGLRSIIDAWFFALEEDVLATGEVAAGDEPALLERSGQLMEQRLARVAAAMPVLPAVLRAYREAVVGHDPGTAEGLLAWLAGQPNVAASIKRRAGIKGDLDHFGALSLLQGLLLILRDAGHPGLVLVMDEVETLQRVRGDVRDKGLNALRQWIDEVDAQRFPGLYLAITGTPAFFDGPQGVKRLAPLAQRLQVDFATEARFDNPRAVQLRLPGFDLAALCQLGRRIRDLYATHAANADRLVRVVDDDYVALLARAVSGELGGKVGIAPRLYLKKLVADVLDRVDQHADFDPRVDYRLTMAEAELTAVERQAAAAASPDDIELVL